MKANIKMATKKTKEAKVVALEPVVTRGSHSTRTEYPDGRVEFETHWDELVRDVAAVLSVVPATKPAKKKATKVKEVKETTKSVAKKKKVDTEATVKVTKPKTTKTKKTK